MFTTTKAQVIKEWKDQNNNKPPHALNVFATLSFCFVLLRFFLHKVDLSKVNTISVNINRLHSLSCSMFCCYLGTVCSEVNSGHVSPQHTLCSPGKSWSWAQLLAQEGKERVVCMEMPTVEWHMAKAALQGASLPPSSSSPAQVLWCFWGTRKVSGMESWGVQGWRNQAAPRQEEGVFLR